MKLEVHTVERVKLPTACPGSWYGEDGQLVAKTLELPDKNNRRGVSCFPEGWYIVTKEQPIPANDPQGRKERGYVHFRIHNVPGRSGILVHRLTYVKDLEGCIGVGSKHVDLNADGIPDIVESGKTLQWMAENLPDMFILHVKEKAK